MTVSVPSQSLLNKQNIAARQCKLLIGLLSVKVNYTICYLNNADDHPESVWTLAKSYNSYWQWPSNILFNVGWICMAWHTGY